MAQAESTNCPITSRFVNDSIVTRPSLVVGIDILYYQM